MNGVVELLRGFLGSTVVVVGSSLEIQWGDLILRFVLPVAGVYVVLKVIVVLVRRLVARTQFSERARASILRWVRIAARLVFLIVILLIGANLFGDRIRETLAAIYGFLREPFFTSGSTRISVITLLMLIPIFYAATWAGNSSRRLVEQRIIARLNIDAARRFSIVSLVRYAVMTIVVIIGLSVIGVNLSSLTVLFGVLGLGIGFGLQGAVANLFAGLMIIVARPIKEGDRVHIGGLEGDVEQIKILYSVVNTITNETLIVPNRQIVENTVHNQSYGDPGIILMTDVQVAYRSDLDRVRDVLMLVGERVTFRTPGRDPRVLFRSFDDSGITVTLAIAIANSVQRHLARSEIIVEIWRAFRDNGIEIPFPQRDLYVKSLPDAPSSAGRP